MASLLSPCRMSIFMENRPLDGWGLTTLTHTPGCGDRGTEEQMLRASGTRPHLRCTRLMKHRWTRTKIKQMCNSSWLIWDSVSDPWLTAKRFYLRSENTERFPWATVLSHFVISLGRKQDVDLVQLQSGQDGKRKERLSADRSTHTEAFSTGKRSEPASQVTRADVRSQITGFTRSANLTRLKTGVSQETDFSLADSHSSYWFVSRRLVWFEECRPTKRTSRELVKYTRLSISTARSSNSSSRSKTLGPFLSRFSCRTKIITKIISEQAEKI